MRKMRLVPMIGLIAVMGLLSSGSASAVTEWDQRNDGPLFPLPSGSTLSNTKALFTPTLDAVDTVQLCLGSLGTSSDVQVEIREGSATGPVLGTSDTQTVQPGVDGAPEALIPRLTTFHFTSPIPLTPGDDYYIRANVVAGANAKAWHTYDHNDLPYPFGVAGPWFREGLGVDVGDADPADAASYVGAPTCPGV